MEKHAITETTNCGACCEDQPGCDRMVQLFDISYHLAKHERPFSYFQDKAWDFLSLDDVEFLLTEKASQDPWVELQVGKVSLTVNVLVANIKVDGIIGMDFMLSTGSTLDCSTLQLNLQGDKVKCKSATGELFCAQIVVTETNVFAPWS